MTKTFESEGCDFCQNEKRKRILTFNESRDFEGYVLIDEENLLTVSNDYGNQRTLEIEYCPMCGRRLIITEENQDDISNDEAREYWKDSGLTYDVVKERDIAMLKLWIGQEYSEEGTHNSDITVELYGSDAFFYKAVDSSLKRGTIYLKSSDWNGREGISFNRDGFIGFCGGLSTRNTQPAIRAFVKWVDWLAHSENTKKKVER